MQYNTVQPLKEVSMLHIVILFAMLLSACGPRDIKKECHMVIKHGKPVGFVNCDKEVKR